MDCGSHKLICLSFCDVLLFHKSKIDVVLGFYLWPFVINWQLLSCIDRLEVEGVGINWWTG